MLHNSGPYGPNDVPINMGMPVNMTQMSNPMNLGNNLANLAKMPQQAAQTRAPSYDMPDYSPFVHPPLNIGHPMSPFPNYHPMNFQTNYTQPSSILPHNTTSSNMGNSALPMNLNTHSDLRPNLTNYPNFEGKNLDVNNERYGESFSRKVPINIPQIHTKAFQKHLGMDANYGQYNQDTLYSHDSSRIEKSLIDSSRRKSLENTVKLIENILINNTPKDKLKKSTENNTQFDNLSDIINSEIKNSGTERKERSTNINSSHEKSSAHNSLNVTGFQSTNTDVKDLKSDEDFGINLSNKNSPNVIDDSKSKLQDKKLDKDTKISTKHTGSDMLLSILLSKPRERDPLRTKVQSEIHCEPLRRSLINNTRMVREEKLRESDEAESEKELIAEVNIKKEIIEEDVVQVKVEPVEYSESEAQFLKDSNATHRDSVEADAVLIEDNNVAQAKEAAKTGTNQKTYFECSHCNILFKHPKRFLIHTKWHTFGLTSEKRHRLEKEKELKKSMKREARIIERLAAKEVKEGDEGDHHPCKDCDKVFSAKSSLRNHRQKYHPTRVRECKICQQSVVGWMALRAHMAAHAAGAGFACSECPKRFKYAHSLAKHRDTHLEKTHSCDQCDKKFGSQALLKMHSKCHERAARGATFRCTYCGKGFFESYNLQVHERTHRNERPFTCDICKTSFGTNSSLQRHLKVSHSTSKPFACPTCHRSFASATTRARHTARAHGDSSAFPFKCALCPRQYSANKELQKHIGKVHREERDRGDVG